MENLQLRVTLHDTLKKYNGGLFHKGTIFTGPLMELPEEIRVAVKKKKKYVSVIELPPLAEMPESPIAPKIEEVPNKLNISELPNVSDASNIGKILETSEEEGKEEGNSGGSAEPLQKEGEEEREGLTIALPDTSDAEAVSNDSDVSMKTKRVLKSKKEES